MSNRYFSYLRVRENKSLIIIMFIIFNLYYIKKNFFLDDIGHTVIKYVKKKKFNFALS